MQKPQLTPAMKMASWQVFFPEGTTRAELFPRTMSTRYRIRLLDNYELREVYDKHREISILLYPPA